MVHLTNTRTNVPVKNGSAIRVLLIEDDPIAARLLDSDFRLHGRGDFELITARKLSEAVEIFEKRAIDVVLLDLFLEDAAGLETVLRVRSAAPDIPVVVLTGLDDEKLALEALKQGAQDYIVKSNVESHVLFRAIRYAIERRQAEAQRHMLEQRLLEMQKLEAVDTLAGGVAHNFNNTLMVILGHSSLLLEECQPNHRSSLEAIQNAAERAAALTRQLLTFSRKNSISPNIVSMNKIVSDMQMLLESILPHNIHLHVKLSPEPSFVKVDTNQIKQMILNLVLNARDAMPDGGDITIETDSLTVYQEDRVVIRIRDTGCGMSSETCTHIFEPFFTTKGAQTSGLGLSTVYGIVKQHGGSINVSTRVGAGAVFSISLPECTGVASAFRTDGFQIA